MKVVPDLDLETNMARFANFSKEEMKLKEASLEAKNTKVCNLCNCINFFLFSKARLDNITNLSKLATQCNLQTTDAEIEKQRSRSIFFFLFNVKPIPNHPHDTVHS